MAQALGRAERLEIREFFRQETDDKLIEEALAEPQSYHQSIAAFDRKNSIHKETNNCWRLTRLAPKGALSDPEFLTFVKHLHKLGAFSGHYQDALILLERACQEGHSTLAKALVLKYLDPWKTNDRGETALHILCRYQQTNLVQLLLERSRGSWKHPLMAHHHKKNPLINQADAESNLPIHVVAACSEDNVELLQLLISEGAHVNARNAHGQTPMHLAVDNQAKKIFGMLCSHAGKVSIQDNDGNLPLHLEIMNGHLSMARDLLIKGDCFAVKNKYGESPLTLAVNRRLFAFFSVLDEGFKGLNEPVMPEGLKLWEWALEQDRELFEYLLNLESVSSDIHKEFFKWILRNDCDSVKQVLEQGLPLEKVKGRNGFCPVHRVRHLEMLETLQAYSLDLHARDEEGKTAIWWACLRGDLEIVLHLMALGVNPRLDPKPFCAIPLAKRNTEHFRHVIQSVGDEVIQKVCEHAMLWWDLCDRSTLPPLIQLCLDSDNSLGVEEQRRLTQELNSFQHELDLIDGAISVDRFESLQESWKAILDGFFRNKNLFNYMWDQEGFRASMEELYQLRTSAQVALTSISVIAENVQYAWDDDLFLGALPYLYSTSFAFHKYKDGLFQSLYAQDLSSGIDWRPLGINVRLLEELYDEKPINELTSQMEDALEVAGRQFNALCDGKLGAVDSLHPNEVVISEANVSREWAARCLSGIVKEMQLLFDVPADDRESTWLDRFSDLEKLRFQVILEVVLMVPGIKECLEAECALSEN